MNIFVEIDAHAVVMRWTDREPDGDHVFATLQEAKERALRAATDEQKSWAKCVRDIRSFTLDEVAPAWN